MNPRRKALLLVVIGLLCVPARLYFAMGTTALVPPAQTSQVYAAEPITLDSAVTDGLTTVASDSVWAALETITTGYAFYQDTQTDEFGYRVSE